MSTADISAEMLLGAAGCASGSQMCRGMTPALTPKPRKNSTQTAVRTPPETTPPLTKDIAGLAIFLASRAGAFTVGAVITCDGGLFVS